MPPAISREPQPIELAKLTAPHLCRPAGRPVTNQTSWRASVIAVSARVRCTTNAKSRLACTLVRRLTQSGQSKSASHECASINKEGLWQTRNILEIVLAKIKTRKIPIRRTNSGVVVRRVTDKIRATHSLRPGRTSGLQPCGTANREVLCAHSELVNQNQSQLAFATLANSSSNLTCRKLCTPNGKYKLDSTNIRASAIS